MMEKNYIYNVLTKRGYDEYSARLVAAELTNRKGIGIDIS